MRRLTENYSALLLGKRAISEEAGRPADAALLGYHAVGVGVLQGGPCQGGNWNRGSGILLTL